MALANYYTVAVLLSISHYSEKYYQYQCFSARVLRARDPVCPESETDERALMGREGVDYAVMGDSNVMGLLCIGGGSGMMGGL